jgi:putative phosphoesterase
MSTSPEARAKDAWVVGVLSDTHGLLRVEALRALEGSDLIVHAGDIGNSAVLRRLGELAPTHAVRGNVDQGNWANNLPPEALLEVGACRICVVHDLDRLELDTEAAGVELVVFGHTHLPTYTRQAGVLCFNPGSVGPRRPGLPVSLGRLVVRGHEIMADHIWLTS